MNLSLLVVFPYLRFSFFSHCFSTSPLTLVRNFIRLILFYFTLKISLNTMKSKICSNLFFAGEVTYVFSFEFFEKYHVNTYAEHDIGITTCVNVVSVSGTIMCLSKQYNSILLWSNWCLCCRYWMLME
jgi:hypothetical protein